MGRRGVLRGLQMSTADREPNQLLASSSRVVTHFARPAAEVCQHLHETHT